MKKPNTFSEVPKEWKIVRIEDVIEDYQNGYAFSAKKYAKSGLPIVSMSSISLDGRFQFSYDKCKFWDESKKEDLKSFLLKKGDVIIAMTDVTPDKNLIGRMALVTINDTFLLNQRVGLFRLKKDVICNKFLAYIGNSSSWINYCQNISSQGAQANIGTKDIRRSYIPLPPLPEQQKIADILSTVDEKIAVIDQQITATEELKKGLMQRLLTKGIGHTEFKDSPLGKIPKSWETLKLVKHIDLLSGFAFKSNKFNEDGKGTKLLRGINITIGKLRWSKKIDKWWDIEFDDFEKYSAQVGDLVISMDGSLVGRNYARVQKKDLPLLIVQRVARLRAKETLDLEYLNQIIGSPLWLNYVDAVKTSSGIPHISAKDIKEFKIPFPPISEQKEIAEILSGVDIKIKIQKDKKQGYQQLKDGLMQQLLTGKIRVNNLVEA